MSDSSDLDKPSNGQSSLPAISLPKGGGAIRGIGEKVGANPAIGTAFANIPIFTSPGRSSFGPSLSLSYDSGSGNGPFGFGWSLSLPSITRKTEKGLPVYRDVEEADTLILSGSEDLVPELIEVGQWKRHSFSRTLEIKNESGTLESVAFHIQRYRPRIEGLFARIERWTNTKTGETHWRSISRDNITTLYGKTKESRISDPDDPLRTFSWLICESYDDKGNTIVYNYLKENSADIDLTVAHERNRSEKSRSANRYLKNIKYGNLPSRLVQPDVSQLNWMFEIVFDYGEHDKQRPAPQDSGKWLCRHDPFSSYRAGFEIRTYRLCQRVLMFHHFPNEIGVGNDCLVRSTDFVYRNIRNNTDDLTRGHPIASFISSVTQNGYKRLLDGNDDNGYLKRSLPPVEFEYSEAVINEEINDIDSKSLENLPYGIDGTRYQWADLDCEGVSGILTEQADTWFYKPNLGSGTFGPIKEVAFRPSQSDLNHDGYRLMDLAGDGKLDVVRFSGPTPGFFERNDNQNWENFVPFESFPNIDWNDPNLRMVDLTGDGCTDILVTENEALRWWPSLAELGFGPSSTTCSFTVSSISEPQDDELVPRIVFSDATQSIYLADMSGDGLTDLVRIRNGNVCYWPNLGYGQFGPKVTMDNSPWFEAPDMFDQSRIRLADIDGSGVTDIIYIGRKDGVCLYFNQSGNSWTEPLLLNHFPHIDNISSVMALDFLGNGTACLVWSSSLVGDTNRSMRYIDLMAGQKMSVQDAGKKRGQKPHLLISIKNNLGAETRLDYASSTQFYLADKAAGKPWVTKLPFPVHVVERIKTYDHINRNFFVSHYAYHHGYFDGVEREFRGFGMVEQYDTEEFGTLRRESEVLPFTGENIDESSHVPPVLTKTWFHTGIYLGREHTSNFFAGHLDVHDTGEYYREPTWKTNDEEAKKHVLNDTLLPLGLLTVEEEREACRALKGLMLRQEVYALDGNDKAQDPYVVTEQNFSIRMLQPQGDKNRHAVFFSHSREAITYHYERNPGDPRISHSMTLEVDKFGNVLKKANIGYGRRQPFPNPNNFLLEVDIDKQTKRLITYIENRVTNAIDIGDDYRTSLSCESCTYELTGDDYRPTGVAGRFQPADFVQPDPSKPNGFIHIFDREINYEDYRQPAINSRQRRLIKQVRILYRKNDLTALSPLGELESLALQGESYKLAFTPGLLTQVFQRNGQPLLPNDPTDPNSLTNVLGGKGGDQGGYVSSQELKADGKFPNTDLDNHWWIPTGQVFYSTNSDDGATVELEFARNHFFLPHRFLDPFGKNSIIAYDSSESDPQRNYSLLITETYDPVGNRVTVGERKSDGQIDPEKPGNDYRVLQPRLLTDPNRNRMEVAFDALGLVAGTAVKGKDDTIGDTLNDEFKTDLTPAEVDEFYDVPDPHVTAPTFLKGATTRIIYDLHRFRRTQHAHPEDPNQWLPVYTATLKRETHVRDQLQPQVNGLRIQISFSYSDGFGREIQKKIQAEPESGTPMTITRWVGSGWTVFSNKGKIVRQYESFFSELAAEKRHHFEFNMRAGVSPILFYDPVERVVVTLHPNHTYEKVVFDPWQQVTYDVNDTVAPHSTQTGDPRTDLDIHGYVSKYFSSLTDPTTWQSWLEQRKGGDKGPEEQVAAARATAHANTPTTIYFDTLARPFLTMMHNRFDRDDDDGVVTVDEFYATRVELDIEGNQREIRDAIKENDDAKGRIVMRYDYDMLGNRIHQLSMEAGGCWMLNDVAGKPIRAWDSRGHTHRIEYDAVRRLLRSFVTGANPSDPSQELLTERMVYGEQHSEDELRNLRGKLYLHLDQAGVGTTEVYDFKGNPVYTSRRLARQYKQAIDWRAVDDNHVALPISATEKFNSAELEAVLAPLLENDTFSSGTTNDALNRPVQVIVSHTDQSGAKHNIIQPTYNEASLLERMNVWLEQPTEPTGVLDPATVIPSPVGIDNIDYDAKGQRVRINYDNGSSTFYEYDPLTLRLVHLLTARNAVTFPDDCPSTSIPDWPGCHVQNLSYTYDPVGNIVHVRDDAQQTIFFRHKRVEPTGDYSYDAIYRLMQATGREHLGQVGTAPSPHSYNDLSRVGLKHPNDGRAMGTYVESYVYDAVGNLLKMHHIGDEPSNPGWTRHYAYRETSLIEDGTSGTLLKRSNRLSDTTVQGNHPLLETYTYDNDGNMTRMPQLQIMQWDYKDQLCMTQRQKINDEDEDGIKRHGEQTYYVYDATGQRTRKITELPSGKLKDERVYMGQLEVYRRYSGANAGLVRETLHVMHDGVRIAMVETRNDIDDATLKQLVRYQFTNHLGSAMLELDEQANIISYEEYFPYGSTSYQAGQTETEVKLKRYRYTGMERDEESGLNYHSARYYAPWLGRWCSTDPIGLMGGINLYVYVASSPLMMSDPSGEEDVQSVPYMEASDEEILEEVAQKHGINPADIDFYADENEERVIFDFEDRERSVIWDDDYIYTYRGSENIVELSTGEVIDTWHHVSRTKREEEPEPWYLTALDFVPIVGGIKDIVQGNIALGIASLVLDLATFGNGSLLKGTAKTVGKEIAENAGEALAKDAVENIAETATKNIVDVGSNAARRPQILADTDLLVNAAQRNSQNSLATIRNSDTLITSANRSEFLNAVDAPQRVAREEFLEREGIRTFQSPEPFFLSNSGDEVHDIIDATIAAGHSPNDAIFVGVSRATGILAVTGEARLPNWFYLSAGRRFQFDILRVPR